MTEVLIEPFTCDLCGFMRSAFAAGLLTVVATALVGTWVVLRGMTFLGDALAHGVLPGVAVAAVVGFDLQAGAALGAAGMIAGVNLVHRRARLTEDAGIGLLFVGMLALGVVIVSRRSSFAGDLTAFLFGDAIGVTSADLRTLAIAASATLVATVALYRPFLVLTFSQRKAEALGLRPALSHAVLLGLVGLAIVASFQAVGALLVFGFLVAPPATASLVARRVPTMMGVAVVVGAVGVVAGLLLSYHVGTAASATMTVVAVAEFFLVLAVRDVRRAVTSRSVA